ncbi:MAG: low-specificity L-threonine aldolase [Proteobacteria bacterium]|nr:low-specificity L-threonine aldolase [Pseudomonadota bacterium]MBU1137403.1 low-specificity L-threonine aldolase [Pseudomonadota bacterium]
MKIIDLRSDTVTRPCPAMRSAMAQADVGDDVFAEDPTVNRLEKMAADMLGFESALFASSGTQTNLLALLSHCQRGDEYIVGQQAHTYRYEGGGAAVLGSIQPQPIEFEPDSTLDLAKVKRYIKPDDFHCARTRLLCLENTQAGKALPMHYLASAASFAKDEGLQIHLDGARIFNAALKRNVSAAVIATYFDSVSLCLSKGLGAPVGSLLCASSELIREARKWRKMLGGGMRQAGILAAAGIFALAHNRQRLAEDHENAALLAQGLSDIDEIAVDFHEAQTNMVYVDFPSESAALLPEFLQQRGILVSGGAKVRLVTHLDVAEEDIQRVVEAYKEFFSG